MEADDPMPVDVARLSPGATVGDVVMKSEMTAFLKAAAHRGCRVQPGIDMLYAQIPAYLAFFGFPTTTAENLRAVSRVHYETDLS
jgi:shikimate dehydrogenase